MSPRVISSPPSITRSSELARDYITSITASVNITWLALSLPLKVFRNKLEPTLADVNHNDASPPILEGMVFTGVGSPHVADNIEIIHDQKDYGRDMSFVMHPYSVVSIFPKRLVIYT